MDNRKGLLLASAARLYSVGVDLKGARHRLRKLWWSRAFLINPRKCTSHTKTSKSWKGLENNILNIEKSYCRNMQAKAVY